MNKAIIGVLIAVVLPIAVYGQLCTVGSTTCGTNMYCKQIPYYPVGSGNCTAVPTEGKPCDSVGGCVAGLLCTQNFMCASCGNICMAADFVQRMMDYYNMGCGECALNKNAGFHHGSRSNEYHHGHHHQEYYRPGFYRSRMSYVNRIAQLLF